MYANYIKRVLDFTLSLLALVILLPIFFILILLGAFFMGGNPFFTQQRPGKGEKIFKLYKFRTMTNAKDAKGNLLSDAERLIPYGRFLRSTSLDELPELINILKGDMAIIGPRPQLVRDMVFMTSEQRQRHAVRQGLTGLAQCSGRNAMTWEKKIEYDLEYIRNITFLGDLKIVLKTISAVFRHEGITEEGMATAADFGDYLLSIGAVDQSVYDQKQQEARSLMRV